MPRFAKGFQQIISVFNFFLFQGLIIVVLFMPLKVESSYFVVGLVLFIISFMVYIMSLIAYSTSNPDKPVTKGVYKLSRNP